MNFPTKIQYALTFYPESGEKETFTSRVHEIDDKEAYEAISDFLEGITNDRMESVSMVDDTGKSVYFSPFVLSRSVMTLQEITE